MAIRYDQIEVGMALPELVRDTLIVRMAMWASACGDYDPRHYDLASARASGLDDCIVNGKLKASLMAESLAEWAGVGGQIVSFKCRYRGVDFARTRIIVNGKVTGKRIVDGQALVDCELWCEDPKGKVTTSGSATLKLSLLDSGAR